VERAHLVNSREAQAQYSYGYSDLVLGNKGVCH